MGVLSMALRRVKKIFAWALAFIMLFTFAAGVIYIIQHL